jgi:hypothetical protein
MTDRRFTVLSHALVWVLLLVTPYVSTDQLFTALDSSSESKYLMTSLALSAILISTFYVNHFLLIPRYLLNSKYWWYFSLLLLTVLAVFLLFGFIFFFPNTSLDLMPSWNPAVEKVFPVITVNALLLWLLSIVSSILWTFYNRLKQTESEKLTGQIASLKSQINPHFLFNTLNNIYATAIDTSPKAADMVDKLSEMMRYTMKDTHQDFVLLEDEIHYVSNYIELQKIRLDRRVTLECRISENVPDLLVAPMLLIPFIENAFKHGVNSEQKSWIRIEILVDRTQLELHVVNNKVDVQRDISEKSGLGIRNTRLRLNLIYPSNHLLVINDSQKEYSVSLHINLQ